MAVSTSHTESGTKTFKYTFLMQEKTGYYFLTAPTLDQNKFTKTGLCQFYENWFNDSIRKRLMLK